MSDQQQPPAPLAAPSMGEVLDSLLHAINTHARKSTGSTDVREVQEFGAATLSFAQAYAILHPDVVAPQGVTPDRILATVPQQPKESTKAAGK